MSHFSCFGGKFTGILARNQRRMGGAEAPAAGDPGETSGAGNQPDAGGNIPPTITLRRIKNATKNFRHDKNIGEGGSAHVFNGKFKKGQICAVKRLKPAAHRDTDYNNEVHLLSRLSHPNIINVVGCCADDDEEERIVVYEFMPLGTLYDQLHARKNGQAALDWDTRMRIAAGVAKGLSYLHNEADPQIIYRDLKPTNVLLGDGFHPRISDFGIAKSAPFDAQSSTVTTAVLMGTPPYWAPENALAEGHSFKSDVYSFGAVLLEIIVCDVPLDTSSGGAVAHWVKIEDNMVKLADPEMNREFPEAMLKRATNLALICMNVTPDLRPDMKDVVRGMNHLAGEPNAEWPEEFNTVLN